MAIRVLVVDDHAVVRSGVVAHVSRQKDLEVVGEAASCEEAIAGTAETKPDVVLMDIRLDDGSGIDACRVIRSEHPETKVVMFTTFADVNLLRDALDAGASGYVIKRMQLDALTATVRQVMASDEIVLDPQARTALAEGGPETRLTDKLILLSPQERRVLSLIADGLTNRQIADELNLAEKTVKNYVSALLHKLDMTRRAEAAAFRAAIASFADAE